MATRLAKGGESVRFGAYSALRLLGRGGTASVYEATDESSGRRVALKVSSAPLPHDSFARRRFLREAELIARVRHPHVVRVFELGLEGDVPFIVMELLRGETLAQHLSRLGRMPTGALVEAFTAICSAVSAIHDAGIVHRDLKTSNVVLAHRPGSRVHPTVLDFGISKIRGAVADETLLTHSRGLLGTVRYLSPEQTLNARAAGPFSDQYALGVMLYEAATGKSPFVGGSTYELMHAIVNGNFLPPRAHVPDLPPLLDQLIVTAMDRDVSRRFSSVAALADALAACAGAERAPPRPCRVEAAQSGVSDLTEHDGFVRPFIVEARLPGARHLRRTKLPTSRRFLPSAALCAFLLTALVGGDFRQSRGRTEVVAAAANHDPPRSGVSAVQAPAARVSLEGPAGAPPAPVVPAASGVVPAPKRRALASKRRVAAAPVETLSKASVPGKDETIDPFAPID